MDLNLDAHSNGPAGLEHEPLLMDIARYVCHHPIDSAEAFNTAHWCFMDTIGTGLLALNDPECTKLMGPLFPGGRLPNGTRVPGTSHELDPVNGAFNIGCMSLWLKLNDTCPFLKESCPAANLAGILALADYISRWRLARNMAPLTMYEVLTALIKAHEIQGGLARSQAFQAYKGDPGMLVKVATAAVTMRMLGGNIQQVHDVLSHAFADGHAMRLAHLASSGTTRHRWADADASARGVRLAIQVLREEPGIPGILSTPEIGFQDRYLEGHPLELEHALTSDIINHTLFRVAYPVDTLAQTAVEAASHLHEVVNTRYTQLQAVHVYSNKTAMQTLLNTADPQKSLTYFIAVALLHGTVKLPHLEYDFYLSDARIKQLCELMTVHEHATSASNLSHSIELEFVDGSRSERITVDYPLGHRQRRQSAQQALTDKFLYCLQDRFPKHQAQAIYNLCSDHERFNNTAVSTVMELMVIN